MIQLPNVRLWTCAPPDIEQRHRLERVLRYCTKRFSFSGVTLFSYYLTTGCIEGWQSIQVPRMDLAQWNIFHTHMVPRLLHGADYYMCVHEDGFPIIPQMWNADFLRYDYIGAPWGLGNEWGPNRYGVVGNRGFCIESQKFLNALTKLPFMNPHNPEPSDVFACVTHRKLMEDQGVVFAPTELAERFSTEQTGKERLSFGFHGRRDSAAKYAYGWKLIEDSEK